MSSQSQEPPLLRLNTTESLRSVEHPILTYRLLIQAANPVKSFQDGIAMAMREFEWMWTDIEQKVLPGALPRGISEVFGYRLSKSAGVRVPMTKLVDTQPEPEDFENFFVKLLPCTARWVLSKRVEQAIPIYYLSRQTSTTPLPAGLWKEKRLHDHFFLKRLNKPCPVGRESYSDFPEQPDQKVLGAARWNSPQRLLTYACRYFLYATHPHNSNVLVDTDANLWLIDHEQIIYRSDFEDIKELHSLVKGSNLVMQACRQVSNISESDIREALAGFSDKYWAEDREVSKLLDSCAEDREVSKLFDGHYEEYRQLLGSIFDNESDAAEYFIERLKAWKSKFKPN